MKLQLITIGKLKSGWIEDGCQDYLKRLKTKTTVEIIEVRDEEQMAKKISPRHVVWLLDEHGPALTSMELSKKIEAYQLQGCAGLSWLIGGADGFSSAFLSEFPVRFSLSKLTFPHQVVRILALEQLYRAFSILHGEPYHRE